MIKRSKVVVVVNALFLVVIELESSECKSGNRDVYARPKSSRHFHLVTLIVIVRPLDVAPPILDNTQTDRGFSELLTVRFFLEEADSGD